MARKVYVQVTAEFNPAGVIRPLSITWEDGTKYDVDRVMDIRPAASLKAGGAGIRYTCRVLGQVKYLWLEGNRWFVEANDLK